MKNYRSPVGTKLSCKSWIQEAAFRMIQNNLDPEVAEEPKNLIIYGGRGKAARNYECLEKILETLKKLENDETLLVQSGKPVGFFKTYKNSPRVLIANSNLVPHWAHWEHFDELDQKGLIMYGQMTAGSWIYIGSQGIIQGTYETFNSLAQKHFSSNLSGKIILTAGLGGMGGAQPLAGVFSGASVLAVEVDSKKIKKRLDKGFVDEMTEDIDRAIHKVTSWAEKKQARSMALKGNMSEVIHRLLNKNFHADVVTDQTSAHDLLKGYIPRGYDVYEAEILRKKDPEKYKNLALNSIKEHVKGLLEYQKRGSVVFDYGNNIRAQAKKAGLENAFDFPGFVSEYIRPLFCKGSGPFRWVALSGKKEDIYKTDEAMKKLFSHKKALISWLDKARERISFQGLPARICWLEYGEREKAGVMFNQMVQQGELEAPIVIGRDHLDCGSVASPYRETEAMKDGSDAVADWPILNALLNTACGASWVSFHHGGGVGLGYSLHAGQVIVADGTHEAQERLKRVLSADPGLGVIRHLDAGYKKAVDVAKKRGVPSVWL